METLMSTRILAPRTYDEARSLLSTVRHNNTGRPLYGSRTLRLHRRWWANTSEQSTYSIQEVGTATRPPINLVTFWPCGRVLMKAQKLQGIKFSIYERILHHIGLQLHWNRSYPRIISPGYFTPLHRFITTDGTEHKDFTFRIATIANGSTEQPSHPSGQSGETSAPIPGTHSSSGPTLSVGGTTNADDTPPPGFYQIRDSRLPNGRIFVANNFYPGDLPAYYHTVHNAGSFMLSWPNLPVRIYGLDGTEIWSTGDTHGLVLYLQNRYIWYLGGDCNPIDGNCLAFKVLSGGLQVGSYSGTQTGAGGNSPQLPESLVSIPF